MRVIRSGARPGTATRLQQSLWRCVDKDGMEHVGHVWDVTVEISGRTAFAGLGLRCRRCGAVAWRPTYGTSWMARDSWGGCGTGADT